MIVGKQKNKQTNFRKLCNNENNLLKNKKIDFGQKQQKLCFHLTRFFNFKVFFYLFNRKLEF